MSFESRHKGETRTVENPSPYGSGTHEWAPYPEVLDVGKLAHVARSMIEEVADVEVVREQGESVDYLGPPLHPRFFVTAFEPQEALSADKLDFAEEDQGRDALAEVLMVVLQMGIEQGIRISRSGWTDMEKVERTINQLQENRDELPDEYVDLQFDIIKNELNIES